MVPAQCLPYTSVVSDDVPDAPARLVITKACSSVNRAPTRMALGMCAARLTAAGQCLIRVDSYCTLSAAGGAAGCAGPMRMLKKNTVEVRS